MKKILAALLASSTLALTTLPAHAIPITQNLTFSNLEARTGVLNSTGFASGLAAGTANYLGFDRNLGQLDSVELRLRGTHSVSSYLSYPFNSNQNPAQSVIGILNLVPGNNDLRRFLNISVLSPQPLGGAFGGCARRQPSPVSPLVVTCLADISQPFDVSFRSQAGGSWYDFFATGSDGVFTLFDNVQLQRFGAADVNLTLSEGMSYAQGSTPGEPILLDLTYNYTPSIAPPPPPPPGSVPEPATPVLLLLGLGLVFALRRARRV